MEKANPKIRPCIRYTLMMRSDAVLLRPNPIQARKTDDIRYDPRMPEPMPRIAATDAEIDRCFEVMVELRTDLKQDSFLDRIREMEPEGFRLAYLEIDDAIVAVAGGAGAKTGVGGVVVVLVCRFEGIAAIV